MVSAPVFFAVDARTADLTADDRVLADAIVAAGCAVVPKQHDVDLVELMRVQDWDDAVIKPAIGGTARLALHVGDCAADAAQRHLDEMVFNEDALVQQFVPSVRAAGEWSVIAIEGVVTHAVNKRAAEGDWRVHAEFGGSTERVDLGDDVAAAANRAIEAIEPTPLYARIDLVEAANGELQVIELELIEPELFFRFAPHAATRMAQLVARSNPHRARPP